MMEGIYSGFWNDTQLNIAICINEVAHNPN
jgi:hypothetical protein